MKPARLAAPLLALSLLALPASVPAQGPPPGYGHGGWDQPPGNRSPAFREGYEAGIEGARKDVQNHRRPNVENRDEYRHPPHHIPPPARPDYREGFRRGYASAMAHMSLGGPRR